MSKSAKFSLEILKEALDREFGERDSYATFKDGRVHVDLSGFLASDEGKKAFAEEVRAAQAVPAAPGRRFGGGR